MHVPLGYVPAFSNAKAMRLSTEAAMAHTGCKGDHEIVELLNFSFKSGLVEVSQYNPREGGFVSLSFAGYQRVEYLQSTTPSHEQAFVAMWFSNDLDELYTKGIEAAIRQSGYNSVRIDKKHHNNKIDDEIIAEIRRSKFVVADFTCGLVDTTTEGSVAVARGGVYFEAGFAKGLGKDVIWTVREDLLPFVHFDTRQFAHIVWNDAEDLRTQLANRIVATLGEGPRKER